MVRRVCSTLPFCEEVYGQNIHRMTPLVAKNAWEEALSNFTAIVTMDGFDGVAKLCGDKGEKSDKVRNVLDFACKGKLHTK
jgi:hypothetical protein